MPELPEVESIRRGLGPRLLGRRVVAAELRRRDVLERIDAPPHSTRKTPARALAAPALLLAGDVVERLERLGKHLAIVARSGRVLEVHLGMSGQLLAIAPGVTPSRADHVHALWHLDDGGTLLFRDPRRFGGLWAAPSMDALRAARWNALGPDAITITPRALRDALARSRRAIKPVLLDQRVLAGVGNIYADEALFAAGIHPERESRSIDADELARLVRHIHATLRAAIDAGGSTKRDYRDATGSPGEFQRSHRVYARGGQPCVRCGNILRSAPIGQRTTTWCPACQPPMRTTASRSR